MDKMPIRKSCWFPYGCITMTVPVIMASIAGIIRWPQVLAIFSLVNYFNSDRCVMMHIHTGWGLQLISRFIKHYHPHELQCLSAINHRFQHFFEATHHKLHWWKIPVPRWSFRLPATWDTGESLLGLAVKFPNETEVFHGKVICKIICKMWIFDWFDYWMSHFAVGVDACHQRKEQQVICKQDNMLYNSMDKIIIFAWEIFFMLHIFTYILYIHTCYIYIYIYTTCRSLVYGIYTPRYVYEKQTGDDCNRIRFGESCDSQSQALQWGADAAPGCG